MFLALEEQDSVMVSVVEACRNNKAQKESVLLTIFFVLTTVRAFYVCKINGGILSVRYLRVAFISSSEKKREALHYFL